MTREKAIRIAQGLITDFKCESETMVDFCNTVIKALEQQPCEDCISRQAALECLDWKYPDKLPKTKIIELPSVTPQQKIGHWIMIDEELQRYKCSECGEIIRVYGFNNETLKNYRFSHCGAKMVEP